MKIRLKNTSQHPSPEYSTIDSAGIDLRANLTNQILLKPLERTLVKTGLFIELPRGYEAQIRPRSGLAYKKGITVLNSPGTIDSDYRGEIGIILINLSNQEFIIENGERVAQMLIAPVPITTYREVSIEELSTTDRGEGGFGSSGRF